MSEGFQLFKNEAVNIQEHFPGLRYSESQENSPEVLGEIILADGEGVFIDKYEIKITPTTTYPLTFPLVFETGGRIPINVDWHVYDDGHCCIKTIPEEWLICKRGINLSGFIEKQVIPYFFNQKHRELHGYFLREHSHGPKGLVEFFEDQFKTKDINVILNGLSFIRGRREPSRVGTCFCGSGQKYRKCHRETYRSLKEFNNVQLDAIIKMINQYMLLYKSDRSNSQSQ